jgi:hypothetical protein
VSGVDALGLTILENDTDVYLPSDEWEPADPPVQPQPGAKFRAKPIEVEAIRYMPGGDEHNCREVCAFLGVKDADDWLICTTTDEADEPYPCGDATFDYDGANADPGDWFVKDRFGAVTAVSNALFRSSYEAPPVQPEPADAPPCSGCIPDHTHEPPCLWTPKPTYGSSMPSAPAESAVRAEEGRDEPEPGAWKVGDRFTIVDAEGELDVTEGREYVVIPPRSSPTKLVWCYDDANDLHAFFPHQVSFIDDAAGPAPVPVDPPQPAGSPWKQGDRVRVLPIAQWSSFIGREIYVEHAATDGTFKALINGEPWWFADEEVEAVDPQAETVSDTVTIEVPRAAAIVYANDFKGDVYDWKHPYESFRAACRAALGADQ